MIKIKKKEYEDIRMMQELYFEEICLKAGIDHIYLRDLYAISA